MLHTISNFRIDGTCISRNVASNKLPFIYKTFVQYKLIITLQL